MSNDTPADILADYPRWDDAQATRLESDGTYGVIHEVVRREDGALVIRRTVMTVAYRRTDRHIVWCGDVLVIPAGTAPEFVRDIVTELTA